MQGHAPGRRLQGAVKGPETEYKQCDNHPPAGELWKGTELCLDLHREQEQSWGSETGSVEGVATPTLTFQGQLRGSAEGSGERTTSEMAQGCYWELLGSLRVNTLVFP